MDEIEYKLGTNNSVLIVNAVDKLISTIKSKFKLLERQKFVVENEELKFLREKCSSKDSLVSLTACQGLLALVQLGVLEIGHTMSTVVTMLPTAHNYSAIISTIAGLLTLDLKSRLVPGQPYKCQFSLTSPKHPFIMVLERNKKAEDEVISQMHAMCTHPDYTISTNSLELLRPVFLWLTCSGLSTSQRPWQLLLSLPPSSAQSDLLITCISCQQYCHPDYIDRSFCAYSLVSDAAIYQLHGERVVALLPMLARMSNELVRFGRDPRSCYAIMERCIAIDVPDIRNAAPLTIALLAENLINSSALYLHELFNLCLNIINKYECSSLAKNILVALSIQWLHLPSYLTTSALKIASKILDLHRGDLSEDSRLFMANLINNKTFETFLYTDGHLNLIFKVLEKWERIKDNLDDLENWLDDLATLNERVLLELLPFFLGVMMEKRKDGVLDAVTMKTVDILISLVNVKKEVSVQILPVLLYKIANDDSPKIKFACLKALPVMAKTKENVPTIVAILNKLKANKGVPTSFLIMLYTILAETQVRCFPYLQELLVESGSASGRADDLKWEIDIARAVAIRRICELRTSSGIELVPVISSILNKCTDRSGCVATTVCLESLVLLWRAAAVAPASTWRALEPKLGRDIRPTVIITICKLLSEISSLRVSNLEYDALVRDASRRLWKYIAEGNDQEVIEAACQALACYKLDDYKLVDVPEIYRRTVKLPPSYCKTPADAARRPEDVLDYIPCEIWPEVFKYTNQLGLEGVVKLTTKLIEREIKSYRSGVYQPSSKSEPTDLGYLPATSVLRGLMGFFRKQATSPTYDCPEPILLSILTTLTVEYPKPLPPMELCFLHELYHRGSQWKPLCVKMAARQANTSGSARRFLENYLQGLSGIEPIEETDIILVFDLLPILCRTVPPNSLRTILDKSLTESFKEIANLKVKESQKKAEMKEEYMFIKELIKLKECLECEKIHDANRTLLSQIVEKYFVLIPDDNVSWPHYVDLTTALSSVYLERMSAPSGWWEVPCDSYRKACDVRTSVAVSVCSDAPLVWLNEIIDAAPQCLSEHEYSLRSMVPVFQAVKVDDKSTTEWFLQLMARTQVAFKELEDESSKLYLCDVLSLCCCVWSGVWAAWGVVTVRAHNAWGVATLRTALPPAVAGLASAKGFQECILQLIEWLRHTRDVISDVDTSRACQRALLSLRHTDPYIKHAVWRKLEPHLGADATRKVEER